MLFKDSNKLKEYAEFTGDINFASVKKTIRIVEETCLIPLLGLELYNNLNNAYALITDEASLQSSQILLLDKCRMVVGPYVLYHYTPKAEIRVNDAGARRSESSTEKTAYGYQVTNFREQVLREAEGESEALLQFLEANKESYPEWTNSNAFKDFKSLFITTGWEFANLIMTHSPYRNYWAMRFKMKDVEEQVIRKELGNDLFLGLKQKASENSFTEKETDLIFKLKKAIAYYTLAYAIPFLNVRIDAGGISVIATSFNVDIDARSGANTDALNTIINSALHSAKNWLDSAIDFLNTNSSDFPQWQIATTKSCDDGNVLLNGCFGLY